jgi:uncharacterized membrane protein YcaP (DUF421 family)
MKNRKEFLLIEKTLLITFPNAEITFQKTGGKHYLKLLVMLDGKFYKAPLSSSASDRNWFKQSIRQIKKKIFMEYEYA